MWLYQLPVPDWFRAASRALTLSSLFLRPEQGRELHVLIEAAFRARVGVQGQALLQHPRLPLSSRLQLVIGPTKATDFSIRIHLWGNGTLVGSQAALVSACHPPKASQTLPARHQTHCLLLQASSFSMCCLCRWSLKPPTQKSSLTFSNPNIQSTPILARATCHLSGLLAICCVFQVRSFFK